MQYKGKFKSLEEIISKHSDTQVFNCKYIKFILENQNKEVIVEYIGGGFIIVCLGFGFRKEDFETLEEIKENEVWKPKVNENYYFNDGNGLVFQDKYDTTDADEKTIKAFNVWKTKEQAEQVEKAQKLLRAQMAWKFQNDFKPNVNTKCWFIQYCGLEIKVLYMLSVPENDYTKVYFSSKEKAEQCLEFLKKEGLI